MTKEDIYKGVDPQVTDSANSLPIKTDPDLNAPSNTPPDIIIEPMPTLREQLQKVVADSLVWIHKWKGTLQQTITINVQYSPVRFTSSLTPVQISFSGWGFCIYNGKIKHFHNCDVVLKIPVNKQTPIIIFGWGSLFKHSLFIDSSLQTIPNFSVRSDAHYALSNLPTVKLKSLDLTIRRPSKTISVPPSPIFRVNKDVMAEVHRELEKSEDR